MLLRVLVMAGLCCVPAAAAVKAIHVVERTDVLDGRAFGAVGAYERVIAKVFFAVDPKLPQNRAIRDIDFAPRNAEGLVEFVADVYVLRPRDVAKGNGTLLLEIPNRGGKGMVSRFNLAAPSVDPRTGEQFGDGRLLEQGYTLAWLGWQWDVPAKAGLVRLEAPVATDSGKTITGPVRSEMIPETRTTLMPLGDRGHTPYAPAEEATGEAKLAVRRTATGPAKEIARGEWRWSANRESIEMTSGFEPGLLYEFVYTAKDPRVVGLGLAAVRDFVSFAKYQGSGLHVLGDLRAGIKRSIGFGISQSGRFLRTFVYYGFNEDEKGRRVFDGVWADVAGAGRGSFNHRFAQASRDGYPFFNVHYATDLFPFSDGTQVDPVTKVEDGLEARVKPETAAKIIYTNYSTEYWGRAAALIHVTPDGKADAGLPANVRIYFAAGAKHGPGRIGAKAGTVRYPPNPMDTRLFHRAVLQVMQEWVRDGKEPPPSSYPKLAAGELVEPGKVRMPKSSGLTPPNSARLALRLDFGPRFREEGIVTQEPPKFGAAFPALVPAVDADGNDKGGVRLPEMSAPLGTYTGWNPRAPGMGGAGEMSGLEGAFAPFGRDEIVKRYGSREKWLARVAQESARLAGERFLLEDDKPKAAEHAAALWEFVMGKD